MKNILLVIILLLNGVSSTRAAKKSEELQAEETLIYDAQKYGEEIVSIDEVFNPNKIQVYGAMSGDRWKAYNAIYSIFGIENDVNFNRLVDRMILQNKSSFGGACDISELVFEEEWSTMAPLQGRYHVRKYHALGCQGESELKVPRYNTGAEKYGYMLQFCSAVFFGGYEKLHPDEGELGPLSEVVSSLKNIIEEKTADLGNSNWTKDHTKALYNHFYPSYIIKPDYLDELHQAICTGVGCDYDESFEVLAYSLCSDVRWIDI